MATLYEVTVLGTYQAQQIVNRLTFASDIDDPTVVSAFTVLQALGYDPVDTSTPAVDTVLESLLICQTSLYSMTELLCRNLYSVTDFITLPVTGAGWAGQIAQGATGLMSFVATKLRTNRVRTDVRPGTLSLTPPAEGNVDAEGDLDSAMLGFLIDLCDNLNEPPSYTAGSLTAQFRPAVLGKERYNPDPEEPDRWAYRYWPTEAEQLEHTAINVTWSPVSRVSSQVTRKIGRGS